MNVRALLPLLTALALPAPPPAAEEIFRIDDFEDGDRIAATGAAWTSITDALLGSESRTSVSVVGPKGERALRLEGVLARNGFAGLWVAVDGKGRAVDVSAFTAIRLRVKSDGALLVGLRGGKGNGDNFMAAAAGTGSWSTVEIPLTELKARPGPSGTAQAFEPAETRWLGIQTALGTSGAFAFEIDDVALVGARAPGAPHGGATQSRVKRTPASAVAGARWEPLGTDPAGDGKKALLPDAVSLGSWTSGSTVWFRVGLAAPVGEDFGVNLVLDLDGDPANGEPWWGKNTAFRFDLLVSAWAFASSSSTLDGAIGIARAGDAVKGSVIDESLGAPRILATAGTREICIGVPRALLGTAAPIRVVAAVGSTFLHNDDLPDSGAAELARLP